MNKNKQRTGSKSHKRNVTLSCERNLDETKLKKTLDEKAQSKKTITITKEQLKKLKNYKNLFLDLEKVFENEKKAWASERNDMKSNRNSLLQENQELKMHLTHIENKLEHIQACTPESANDQQGNLAKIKNSLFNLESLIAYRSEESSKLLLKIHKLLAKHAEIIFEQSFTPYSKSQLSEGIKKISQTVSSLESLLASQKNSIQTLETQEDSATEEYKKALEKLRAQNFQLREKLSNCKNSEGLHKIIEDQELEIQNLMDEKSHLKSLICELQNQIKDQNDTIYDLKTLLPSPKSIDTYKQSPHSRNLNVYPNYIEHEEEKDLQIEIASLDNEIKQLQDSLKRALVTY
ncbi:hypothetical protein SteCoe_20835 [Stentor coeruleus]|uniref:Uncharacterized protein n=1 Tax=Stentor coeruleus TaxID=5963 RepID=A0A1R2BQU8_9CILI|nr:hypothetical protein SteCoe_20835 [Stentor coeruleus]